MDIIRCPSCNRKLQIDPDLGETQVRCPICSEVFSSKPKTNSPGSFPDPIPLQQPHHPPPQATFPPSQQPYYPPPPQYPPNYYPPNVPPHYQGPQLEKRTRRTKKNQGMVNFVLTMLWICVGYMVLATIMTLFVLLLNMSNVRGNDAYVFGFVVGAIIGMLIRIPIIIFLIIGANCLRKLQGKGFVITAGILCLFLSLFSAIAGVQGLVALDDRRMPTDIESLLCINSGCGCFGFFLYLLTGIFALILLGSVDFQKKKSFREEDWDEENSFD